MSTFLTTMQSPRRTATNPRESSVAWLAGGISTAYPASHPEQVLITTLRLGSSGAPSGIVKFAPGAQAGISGGRFPAPCGPCDSASRPMPSAETTDSRYPRNLERVFFARSVFRAEVRADWAGKFVVCSAPVRVPSLTERNRNFRVDMVLAREHERRALQL